MRIQRRGPLLAQGYTDAELRRGVRDGEIVAVRRGAYVPAKEVPDRPEDRHAIEVAAAVPKLAPDAVVSHVSAAVLLGLPVWNLPLGRVHVTRPRPHGGRVERRLHVHSATLEPEEHAQVAGVVITSPARTVVDIARCASFEVAVSVADAALYKELVTPADLLDAVHLAEGRPGVAAARRVVAFAQAGGQSVGESRSRVRMRDGGLPPPALQYPITTRRGRYRCDFVWEDRRLVGEFDGLVKYGRGLLRPGQSTADAVIEEKLREDAIRDEGWTVVRWIWDELDPFDELRRRIAGRLR